jgi:hypothetical protein
MAHRFPQAGISLLICADVHTDDENEYSPTGSKSTLRLYPK